IDDPGFQAAVLFLTEERTLNVHEARWIWAHFALGPGEEDPEELSRVTLVHIALGPTLNEAHMKATGSREDGAQWCAAYVRRKSAPKGWEERMKDELGWRPLPL